MEVDQAAPLVLGDLRVRDPDQIGQSRTVDADLPSGLQPETLPICV
jgi:hypothetical protein